MYCAVDEVFFQLFFVIEAATTEIITYVHNRILHAASPSSEHEAEAARRLAAAHVRPEGQGRLAMKVDGAGAALNLSVRGQGPVCLVPSSMGAAPYERDRKSTRLNSSH